MRCMRGRRCDEGEVSGVDWLADMERCKSIVDRAYVEGADVYSCATEQVEAHGEAVGTVGCLADFSA